MTNEEAINELLFAKRDTTANSMRDKALDKAIEALKKQTSKKPDTKHMNKRKGFTPQGWYESKIAGRVHYQSSYEHKFMIWLDSVGIKWQKCAEKFPYVDVNGKMRKYNPDIYLPDADLYIEVKGMVRKNDPAKFQAFPDDKQLALLGAFELKKLGLEVYDPGEFKIENRDVTKWPFNIISKLDDFTEIGELTAELKNKVSADKFFALLS